MSCIFAYNSVVWNWKFEPIVCVLPLCTLWRRYYMYTKLNDIRRASISATLVFQKLLSIYYGAKVREHWMKNGLIGSEQTTITCAHIIDPVWKFWGGKGEREGGKKDKDPEIRQIALHFFLLHLHFINFSCLCFLLGTPIFMVSFVTVVIYWSRKSNVHSANYHRKEKSSWKACHWPSWKSALKTCYSFF